MLKSVNWGYLFKRTERGPIDPDSTFTTYSEMIVSDKVYNGAVVCVTNDSDSSKNGIYWVSGNDATGNYEFKRTSGGLSYTLLNTESWEDLLDNNQVDRNVLYFIYEGEDDTPDTPVVPDTPSTDTVTATVSNNTVTFTNVSVANNTLVLNSGTVNSGNLIIS